MVTLPTDDRALPAPRCCCKATAGGIPSIENISINITPLEKVPNQYKERREYVSSAEDSRYEVVLRYNRVA